LLSGESTPALKLHGESLVAGSIVVEGPVELRVERVGGDTFLAGIAELVARAQAARPRLAQAGERAASRFVLRVLAFTAVTAAAWCFVDPSRAFNAALAVLVVSCPCAFALAVPVAITRALAVLAQRGVLVVKPDAIEALASATHVVFDKTGTLTQSELSLDRVQTRPGVSREHALALAAALARESRHPAARAIAAACTQTRSFAAIGVETLAGLGVRGIVDGRELRLGRRDFALGAVARAGAMSGDGALSASTSGAVLASGAALFSPPIFAPASDDAVLLVDASGAIAAFHIGERLRPDARETVEALERQGLAVLISSGDAAGKVEALALRLDVAEWRARQLPADKLARLGELQAAGARVVAVGDGVNDAPALGGADIAVALAEGAELAQASSDGVLTGGRLGPLAPARLLSRETLEILRENQRWALVYNLVAVPLAALGFVPPWLAALGMSFSSLVVVLNALRIGRATVGPATLA
jgi:Cu2+-exporting ATPase